MKIYFALFLLCFLPSFLSQATEQGGIKIALNQQLVNSALNHFFGNLSKFLNDFEIPNIRFFRGCNARNVRGKIFNFNKNSLTFQFNANGIHLMLHNLRGQITTRVDSSFLIFPFHNNAKVSINDLSLDCTVKIVSKMKNGRKLLSAEFVGYPGFRLKYGISMDGALNKILSAVAKYFADKKIAEIMNDKIDGYLRDAIESLPLETLVDSSNKYYLDYSLVNDVRHRPGFIEMNVYGLLYKQGKSDTQNRNRYSLSQLPIINQMENELQLYVSEYSLNSALYTLIQSNNYQNQLKLDDIKTQLLNFLLPGIEKNFGNLPRSAEFYYSTPKLEITEKSINCPITGRIIVRVNNGSKPVLLINYDLVLSLELFVLPGPYISAKILDLSPKTKLVELNDIEAPQDTFETLVNMVKTPTLALVNLLLQNDIKLTFKQLLGLTFRDISLTPKNQYLVVKYNLS